MVSRAYQTHTSEEVRSMGAVCNDQEITCRLELQRPPFDPPSAPLLLQPRSARVAPDLDCAKLCTMDP